MTLSDETARNRFVVALTLQSRGDFEGARGALLSCLSTRDPEWAPRAGGMLGEMLLERDEVDAADVLRIAVDFGHPQWSAAAGVALGQALMRRGEVEAAEAAYRTVIGTGHPDFAAMAWFNLGTLHQSQADFAAAAEAYRTAVASGHPEQAPRAAVNLGVVLADLGDFDAAERAFEQAIASRHAEQAPKAAMNLGALLALRGDTRAATQAFAAGADMGTGEFSVESEHRLQLLLPQVRGKDLVAQLNAATKLDLPPTLDQRLEAHRLLDDLSRTLWSQRERDAAIQVADKAVVVLGPAGELDADRLRLAVTTTLRCGRWLERTGRAQQAYQRYNDAENLAYRLRNLDPGPDGNRYLAAATRRSAILGHDQGWPTNGVVELAVEACRFAHDAYRRAPDRPDIIEEHALCTLHLRLIAPGHVNPAAVNRAVHELAELATADQLGGEGKSMLTWWRLTGGTPSSGH
jgi:tetratricopeptide (TPR) repeat protein